MLPKKLKNNLPLYGIVVYIFIIGLSYIFSVLGALEDHEVARRVGSPLQSVLLGLGLLYLSSRLLNRLYRAWLITFSIIVVAVVREFVLIQNSLNLTKFGLLLVAGAALFLIRGEFKAQSENVKLRSSLIISGVMLLVAVIYGSIGFTRLNKNGSSQSLNLRGGFNQTIKEFTLVNSNYKINDRSKRTEAFLLSLRTLGIASVLLTGYSLLQPLIYKREHRQEDYHTARKLLEIYGGDSEDYFKLWPKDKDFIFSKDGQAGIAYKVRSGVAMSAGDPFGDNHSFNQVIQTFQVFCQKHGFKLAFIHCTNQYQKIYKKHDLTMQKIGEEAVVIIEKFNSVTVGNKKWRHVMNKFTKLGYSFELRQAPHSKTLLEELRRISNDWLASPGRIERGFVMGYFNEEYLQTCTVGILRNGEKQIVGFINLVESFNVTEANIDFFRQRSGAPTNTVDYMMARLLLELKKLGYNELNLGLSPLVGMNDDDQSGPLSKTLDFAYNFGGKIYSFKGLHQFKLKFEPTWRDRYIAFEPGPLNLVKIAQALRIAMKVNSNDL